MALFLETLNQVAVLVVLVAVVGHQMPLQQLVVQELLVKEMLVVQMVVNLHHHIHLVVGVVQVLLVKMHLTQQHLVLAVLVLLLQSQVHQ
jgi:hypothetical protein